MKGGESCATGQMHFKTVRDVDIHVVDSDPNPRAGLRSGAKPDLLE